MKIADFFIALGFDIKGEADVDKTEQSVKKLEGSSLKLLAGVTALNGAFYTMITLGVEAGVALQRFALTTGLSAEELQKWQLTAARGNVAAREMASAIGVVQKARAAIAFGNAEAAAPWMLLGIDPRQDPFKVLEQLRQQVLKLDPAIARQKLSEMGFGEDILFLMRQPGFGRSNLDRRFIISDDESTKLSHLGAAWKEFLFTLGQIGARFSAQFAEPLAAVLKGLSAGLGLMGRFIDWLEGGTRGAEIMMHAMLALLVVTTGLGLALGALTFISAPWLAIIGGIVVGVSAAVLVIQDLWTAMEGGKSAFGVKEDIVILTALMGPFAFAVMQTAAAWNFLAKNIENAKSGLGWAVDALGAGFGGAGGAAGLMGRIAMAQSTSNSTAQTNHINVTVPGGGTDPQEFGRSVGRGAARQITDAFAQLPLPSR